jgi:fumarate hydratase class II
MTEVRIEFDSMGAVSNRCCQFAGMALGSKTPVHPNDHVNMSQSSNDSFPSAIYVAAAISVTLGIIPAVKALCDAIATKAAEWDDIVKIGRTHMPDATPLTLGQEWSGYEGMLQDHASCDAPLSHTQGRALVAVAT